MRTKTRKKIVHTCELSVRLHVPIRYEERKHCDMIDGKWHYSPDNRWLAGEDDECIAYIIYCPYCRKRLLPGAQEAT